MKKLLAIMLSATIIHNTVYAMNIKISDAMNDTVRISGSAADGSNVSIMVINPGYNYSDSLDNSADAVQYVRSCIAMNGQYSFDIQFNIKNIYQTGAFSIVLNNGIEKESTNYTFYANEIKQEKISDIAILVNNISSIGKSEEDKLNEKINTIYSELNDLLCKFSLDTHPLIPGSDLYEIAKAVVYSDALSISSIQNIPISDINTDIILKNLEECILIGALNSSNEAAFINGKLIYCDILNVLPLAEYNDYLTVINTTGIYNIKNGIMSKNFKNIADVKNAFCEQVVINAITNNVLYGNGHVENLLAKYSHTLQGAGCDYSKLDNVNKQNFYNALKNSASYNIANFVSTFNNYKDAVNVSDIGGGTVSSSPGNVPAYIPTVPDSASKYFNDLDLTHWAIPAIDALYEAKVINGKGNNVFDPLAMVTRAEFAKMIILALGLYDTNAVCPFDDIAADHWAKQYIASAYEKNVILGINEKRFAPDDVISREQAATVAYRASKSTGLELGGNIILEFADSAYISDYASEAIAELSKSGIINGKENGNFAPKDNLSRAEAAKIIYGLYLNYIKR